eukprot:Rmarinus@m.1302
MVKKKVPTSGSSNPDSMEAKRLSLVLEDERRKVMDLLGQVEREKNSAVAIAFEVEAERQKNANLQGSLQATQGQTDLLRREKQELTSKLRIALDKYERAKQKIKESDECAKQIEAVGKDERETLQTMNSTLKKKLLQEQKEKSDAREEAERLQRKLQKQKN